MTRYEILINVYERRWAETLPEWHCNTTKDVADQDGIVLQTYYNETVVQTHRIQNNFYIQFEDKNADFPFNITYGR